MGKLSRDKGKRFEREVVHLFKARGFSAHRSSQVDGKLCSDVVVDELPQLHIECKHHQKIAAFRFFEQAEWDKGLWRGPFLTQQDQIPVVVMRETGNPKRVLAMVDFGVLLEWLGDVYH